MADTDSSMSPEKKLLKLIEEPSAGDEGRRNKFDLRAALSPEGIRARISYAREKGMQVLKGRGQSSDLSLKKVIILSRILAALLGAALLANVVFEYYESSQPINMDNSSIQKQMAEAPVSVSPIFSSGVSLDPSARNVFAPYQESAAPVAPEDAFSTQLMNMTQQLKLTGISVYPGDPKRTFCMIEDLSKSMTSFLRKGDTINGMVVDAIAQDGIVLRHGDKTIVLK